MLGDGGGGATWGNVGFDQNAPITAPSTARVSYDTPAVQTFAPSTGYTPPVGRVYGNMGYNIPQAAPSYTPTYYNPGYQQTNDTAPVTPPAPPPPPPVHHTYQEYINNGTAVTDPTYEAQKAALVGKLGDYERGIAGQVGDQNMVHNTSSDPKDLLGFSWGMKGLGKLYNDTKDVNGDDNFTANTNALGGTLGKNYDVSLANFNNEQAHGLRNNAEDFASRGMLGSGSGVWQTARDNLQDQYQNQLTNMTDSTANQYNTLLGNLANQFSQGRSSLTGYLTDASNRMATAANSGLPTSA